MKPKIIENGLKIFSKSHQNPSKMTQKFIDMKPKNFIKIIENPRKIIENPRKILSILSLLPIIYTRIFINFCLKY